MKTPQIILLIALCLTSSVLNASDGWFDHFYPYRLEINLPDNTEGSITLALPLDTVIEYLQKVVPDIVDIDNFALEKVILVEPVLNSVVGGFKCVVQGDNLVNDSSFATLGKKDSPWYGFNPDNSTLEEITQDNHSFTAVMVAKTAIANTRISQPLKLDYGSFYLLESRTYSNASVNNITVELQNPKIWFFSTLYRSYIPKLSPQGRWVYHRSLIWANVDEAELRIATAFIGLGGAGDVNLRKVKWVLNAELPAKASKLHLYYVPRAGHKLTCPEDQMIVAPAKNLKHVNPGPIKAEALNNNVDGILIKGNCLTAWTIPAEYPLKAGFLKAAKPSARTAVSPLRVNLCKGGDATVLLAIDTTTPHLRFVNYSLNLPIEARWERLAPIPVYDGPFPGSTLTETRFDAMMDPKDPLSPPNADGIHLVAITLTAPMDTQAGLFSGTIKCTVETPVPDTESFEIPLELYIAPVTIKPMNHFGVIFGGQYFQIRLSGSPYTKQGLSVFDFHGLSSDGKHLVDTDQSNAAQDLKKTLAAKYYNRMVDFNVQPQLLAFLTGDYSYKITEQQEGKAPLLSDWNFETYDAAISNYLDKRGVPWLPIWHTNGHIMHIHRLSNNVTYSFQPKPDGNKSAWKQVSQEEYFRLVGDFFDAIAEHLDHKGYLEKAVFVVDESDTTTYELMYKYKQALKRRKYASRIKFAHTTYQTGVYTARLPDGDLYMDEVLDIPMPDNDEHFNFFEPSYNALYKKPKNHWVYYVETDHLNIINGGISTIITPLKLKNFGANGWYCWASFIWSMPYPVTENDGWEFKTGPVVNPWLNPFYHHGPGMLSFFYPPDPRGPAEKPTLSVIPSYRLALIRDGIQLRALMEVLTEAVDDAGSPIKVNPDKLELAKRQLEMLWASNPVQWYISYGAYDQFKKLLFDAIED